MLSQLEKTNQYPQSSDQSQSSYEFSDGSGISDFEESCPLQDDEDSQELYDQNLNDEQQRDDCQYVLVDQSYFQNRVDNLHSDDAVSQTITSDLDADLHSYKREGWAEELEAQAGDPNSQQDDEHLNGSTAGFGPKLR